jgi:regulator of sigma E protease
MTAYLSQVLDYVYLAVGFGLVIFFHELGHFIAAKYCDVKVEQFALGFGPAIVAWRKGIGFRLGTTTPDVDMKVVQEFDARQKEKLNIKEVLPPTPEQAATVAKELGIGETEYRFNWVLLGGYVKMLGQDDMKPGVTAADPRAYNNKSIRARMVIVSAGVVMNVIVAAMAFMIVFLAGYPVPPARVGGVATWSPATQAVDKDGNRIPLKAGDEILSCDGKSTIGDFTKIQLRVALAEEGETMPIVVKHLDGSIETLYAKPARPDGEPKSLLVLGVSPPTDLAGLDKEDAKDWDAAELSQTAMPDFLSVPPGDVVTQINGQDVKIDEFWKLNQALDASDGKPISLTLRTASGDTLYRTISPQFDPPIGKDELQFIGLVPRVMLSGVQKSSSARGKLKPGDVVVAIDEGNDHLSDPSQDQLPPILNEAGTRQLPVTLTVLSLGDAQPHQIVNIIPSTDLGGGKIGLGIMLGHYDIPHLVVAQVFPGSAAYDAKIPEKSTITAVNGRAIDNWIQLRNLIASSKAGDALAISYLPRGDDAKPAIATVKLSQDDIDSAQGVSLTADLPLRPMPGTRRTSNPFIALKWGVLETRDSIEELYLTLLRMIQGGVPLNNAMGFVGMAYAGAQLASRGTAWLLWFLANISANLAVVNFLPIPIVDGGLFTLLIIEKIQGKPLSAETQKIVQIVGLVLIVGLFILVTYQDIARIAGYSN